MRQMNKEDKIRACYQHCCLQYVSGEKMTNETLRNRLDIEQENYPAASRIIAETIRAGLVRPDESSKSRKFAQYIPIWS
jgi:predicted HTH transcriptional regulator